MNIFFLNEDPVKAAKDHNDKHVVKMILETAQLLSTAHRVLDGAKIGKKFVLADMDLDGKLYSATHINHPCAVWVRKSSANYKWTYRLFVALCSEYTFRYNKIHKSSSLRCYLKNFPANLPKQNRTSIALAMPDKYKGSDAVDSYRQYYMQEKLHLAKWTGRNKPDWFNVNI